MEFKSGFIAILGKPNAGKSTLINALVGEKVSIVSPKPQTTRNNIIGILNQEACQIVFTDTPGIHGGQSKLDKYMEKSVNNAKQGVDAVLLCVDGSKKIGQREIDFITSFKGTENLFLIITKTDLTNFEKLYPTLDVLNKLDFVKDIIPVSSLKGRNIDILISKLKECLTTNVKYFDDELYTDKSLRFMIGETIREKTLWLLQDEIPHGLAVEIESFKEDDKKVIVDATIVCEKQNHKQIIIGQNGSMIKQIGTKARVDIENLLQKKVFLSIFVKVKEGWRDKSNYVADLGYNIKDLD